MSNRFSYYVKELFSIALPIIMGNLGFILIGIGDVLVAGRHSTDTLSAISIATAITNCIQIFGIGIIVGVSPLLSNFRGEKKSAKKYFFPTIRFSMYLAFIVMCLVLLCVPLINLLDFEANLIPMIKQYMIITAFATFGGYLHASIKEFLQAYEIVLFPNIVTVFAVFLNLLLNVIFVFGLGPIPSMGVVGLAVSSFIVRYTMGFILLIYCLINMNLTNYREFEYYKNLFKIGLPISFAILVEFVAFNSISVIMGQIKSVYAAAQNLVCTLTTVSFMVPLAISNAIAVKVGFVNGAGNVIEMKKYSFVGIVVSVGFMACSGIIFALFPEFLVGIITKDANLVKISVPVIYILSIFQVFDGLQVALTGIFKGLKQTNTVLVSNLCGYWFIAIPVGLVLALYFNIGLRGFWFGLLAGSFTISAIMIPILFKNFRKLESFN